MNKDNIEQIFEVALEEVQKTTKSSEAAIDLLNKKFAKFKQKLDVKILSESAISFSQKNIKKILSLGSSGVDVSILKNKFIKTSAQNAYEWALHVDKGPADDTRTQACLEPLYALNYARSVDKGYDLETFNSALRYPLHAYSYAVEINKKDCDASRTAACKDPYAAFVYAHKFGAHKEIEDAIKGTQYEENYKRAFLMPASIQNLQSLGLVGEITREKLMAAIGRLDSEYNNSEELD